MNFKTFVISKVSLKPNTYLTYIYSSPSLRGTVSHISLDSRRIISNKRDSSNPFRFRISLCWFRFQVWIFFVFSKRFVQQRLSLKSSKLCTLDLNCQVLELKFYIFRYWCFRKNGDLAVEIVETLIMGRNRHKVRVLCVLGLSLLA